jgi:23S rRNA pseudoU1915 N3-methylase RlmH
MKTTLYTISDSDKHFKSAIDEYIKRLSKSVTIHDIKPTKYGTQSQIITVETQTLTKKVKPGMTTIILNPLGDTRSTQDRYKQLYGKNTQLIIGGPYGLDYTQFPSATHVSL